METQLSSENPANTALESRSKRTCTKSTPYFSYKQPRPFKIRTFKFFPKLPLEVRNQIWSYSLPGPRLLNLRIHLKNKPRIQGCRYLGDGELISISFNYDEIAKPEDLMNLNIEYYSSSMSLGPMPHEKAGVPLGPPTLHVNRESRDVALREGYQLGFAGKHGRPELKACEKWKSFGFAEKRIWVNFERDVLFLEDELLVRRRWRYAPEEMEKVKRLGFRMDLRPRSYWLQVMKNFLRVLLNLASLEEVFIWHSANNNHAEIVNSPVIQLDTFQVKMKDIWAELLLESPEKSGRRMPELRVTQESEWI